MFAYADDLRGYDDLLTFFDMFPTYEIWTERLNEFMVFNTVENTKLPEGLAEKIYNMTYARYRTNFFRYSNMSTIKIKMAEWLEDLYANLEVGSYIVENAANLAGQTETEKNYRTDNTDEENYDGYQTDKKETFTDNGAGEIDILQQSIHGRTIIHRNIESLKIMFMNKTNEVLEKELYGK